MGHSLKIVITGASGYVGQNIVPILKDQSEELLLVGRDAAKLTRIFPDVPNCTFEEMSIYAQNFDILIHLSVLNNDVRGSDDDFHDVNVGLALQTANAAVDLSLIHI